ncbi:MAG: hypothetical protein P1V97_35515 [Planctomycetota bacterium]|nr:hypothetical protein [Planctomycetota bacterium]
MKRLLIASCFVFACACQSPAPKGPAVKVTLSDGQVLMGRMSTENLTLKTGLGELNFDSKDAGELGLVKGGNVGESKSKIRLWLLNGSEFVGHWQKPEVDLKFSAGGDEFNIKVPIAKLERLQFQGNAVWSEDAVFRIQTASGDDFFVDVTKNRLPFQTEFGQIRPFLSEIRSMKPLDKKNEKWRVQLNNGTSLEARFQMKVLNLTLAMGPKKISLPLSEIRHMNRQEILRLGFQEANDNLASEPSRAQGSGGGGFLGSRFYSNKAQQSAKMEAAKSWKRVKK